MTRNPFRLALLAAISMTIAAVAAGYAYAKSRSAPIGTGVVVIDTSLGYQGGEAAGTGMVLRSSGEILTNNHVIRGATTIRVVVPGTGHSYAAKVVGYDVAKDVAVLQAAGASDLKTISLGSSTGVKVGQTVEAVGNAGGGGSLVSSTGTITATGRTITVDNDAGGSTTLSSLLETNAGLEPGDSGGPLLNTAGKVVGMDTAASVSSDYQNVSSSDGYAIPIDRALALVKLIVSGKSSATVHIGSTAFLGVSVVSTSSVPEYAYSGQGAVVAAVVSGGPADNAGLGEGDLITAIDGKAVTSPTALGAIILAKEANATITVAYVDGTGTSETASVRLTSGPPQ
ncbi:MAG TPA: trypsin-like peptidase domain-containing protein [Gaiellaceae bacterium]|nr:trypsin-like peptidase domain-containing protein [Gaiellaceae bacterium]